MMRLPRETVNAVCLPCHGLRAWTRRRRGEMGAPQAEASTAKSETRASARARSGTPPRSSRETADFSEVSRNFRNLSEVPGNFSNLSNARGAL
eukprot:15171338-Alexandrium_andersonii.AAC.1